MKTPSRVLLAVIVAFGVWLFLGADASAEGSQQSAEVYLDAIVAENTFADSGLIDEAAERQIGEAFDVDVVIRGIGDLTGFGFDLAYDPQVVHVARVNVNMLLASEPGSSVANLTSNFTSPEDTDGIVTPAGADFAPGLPGSSSGEGVLARVTLVGVGCGASALTVRPNSILGPMLQDSNGNLFDPGSVRNAEIAVRPAGELPCPKSGSAPDAASAASQSEPSGQEGEANATAAQGEAADPLNVSGRPVSGSGEQGEANQHPGDTTTAQASPDEDGSSGAQSGRESDAPWPLIFGATASIVAILAVAFAGRAAWRRRR